MEHDGFWWLGYITMWLGTVFLAALFLMRVLMFWCNLLDDFEEYIRKKMNDDNKYEQVRKTKGLSNF